MTGSIFGQGSLFGWPSRIVVKVPERSSGSTPKPASPGFLPALSWSSWGSRWNLTRVSMY